MNPNTEIQLIGADGRDLEIRGTIQADISIAIGNVEKSTSYPLLVVNNLSVEMLLGLKLQRAFKLHIDTETSKLAFKANKAGIRAVQDEIVPERTQKIVHGSALTKGTIMAKPFEITGTVQIANSVSEVDNLTPIFVMNTSNKPLAISKNERLASFEKLDEIDPIKVNAIQLKESNETINLGKYLTSEQVAQMAELINNYYQAFTLKGEIGKTQLVEHKIELAEGTKPFSEPLRRRAQSQIDETRRQVKQMLKDGIIEESFSPWASAYVLAKKKTGDFRLCLDFRKLNDVTKRSVYPLPNIEDCLESLAGKEYFSQLDFTSGFWQIPMEERSKELTAFRTEDGQFQFKRMPFGLTNAPASFQRMVNALLSGPKGLNLQVFTDDVCIATNTWEEHLEMLEKVFNSVIEANLKLKGSKCVFGAKEVVFLGHLISAKGIKQEPNKLKAPQELPTPTDVSGIKRVMGMFSYYRKFIPKFAILAEPLTKLTRKNVKFEWGKSKKKLCAL